MLHQDPFRKTVARGMENPKIVLYSVWMKEVLQIRFIVNRGRAITQKDKAIFHVLEREMFRQIRIKRWKLGVSEFCLNIKVSFFNIAL